MDTEPVALIEPLAHPTFKQKNIYRCTNTKCPHETFASDVPRARNCQGCHLRTVAVAPGNMGPFASLFAFLCCAQCGHHWNVPNVRSTAVHKCKCGYPHVRAVFMGPSNMSRAWISAAHSCRDVVVKRTAEAEAEVAIRRRMADKSLIDVLAELAGSPWACREEHWRAAVKIFDRDSHDAADALVAASSDGDRFNAIAWHIQALVFHRVNEEKARAAANEMAHILATEECDYCLQRRPVDGMVDSVCRRGVDMHKARMCGRCREMNKRVCAECWHGK